MKRILMLCATAGLLGLGQPAKAAEILKFLCYLPPASVSVKEILTPFIQQVEAETRGEIKFQTYWGGSLGRDPEKQYKLPVDGIGDVVWMSNYLQGGQFPDSTIFDSPNIIQTSTVGSLPRVPGRPTKQGRERRS
jgi:TRAP-type transport system periplasmic protein